MKKHSVSDLNTLFEEGTQADKPLFAEQRTNILLVAGDHYTKAAEKIISNLRDGQNRTQEQQKLRLTKNYIHKICRYYENQIQAKAPGVKPMPKNELELQDKKAAELNAAVWADIRGRNGFVAKRRRWIENFVQLGEVAVKVFWDPNKGKLKGYQPQLDEMGQPVQEPQTDQDGNAIIDPQTGMQQVQMKHDMEKPVFEGDFVFESIPTYDLRRSAGCQTMEESPHLSYGKMVHKKELEALYAGQPDKLRFIKEASGKAYVIFDQNNQKYSKEDKKVFIKETHFRPCISYPNGYFYIYTEAGILEEGEHPFGLYPIVWAGFDEFAGSPRGRSIIKVARPFQAEVNRASSQMATHQITVGDDKLVYQAGTKLAPGALLPGVRGMTYQGAPPQILPGRDGAQFLPYVQDNISEMFNAVMMSEVMAEDNPSGQADPYGQLFKAVRLKLKFAKYVEKFVEFEKEICELFLQLAKKYLPDDCLVAAIGKSEFVNISEFRSTEPFRYQIKVEEMSDDIDTLMGRQLTFMHALQYIGPQLKREDIGRILENMPFVNNKEMFSPLTSTYKCIQNDMLALERGENVDVSPYADNTEYVNTLTLRMSQADFKLLNPQIQQNYQALIGVHEQEQARKNQALIDAKNEFIPVGGAMIKADMYISAPNSDGGQKSTRVELPYQALDWLIQKLNAQGASLDKLQEMNPGAMSDVSGMMAHNNAGVVPGQGGPGAMPQGSPQVPGPQGPAQGPPNGMPHGLPPGMLQGLQSLLHH